MLAGTLARKAVRTALVVLAATFIGFGAYTLVEPGPVLSEYGPLPGPVLHERAAPDAAVVVERYMRLPEDIAVRAIRAEGLHAVVMWRDGVAVERQPDPRDDRVNLYIQDGVVVDARRY